MQVKCLSLSHFYRHAQCALTRGAPRPRALRPQFQLRQPHPRPSTAQSLLVTLLRHSQDPLGQKRQLLLLPKLVSLPTGYARCDHVMSSFGVNIYVHLTEGAYSSRTVYFIKTSSHTCHLCFDIFHRGPRFCLGMPANKLASAAHRHRQCSHCFFGGLPYDANYTTCSLIIVTTLRVQQPWGHLGATCNVSNFWSNQTSAGDLINSKVIYSVWWSLTEVNAWFYAPAQPVASFKFIS